MCAKLPCTPNNLAVITQIMCAKLPCMPNNLAVITQNTQEKADLKKTKVSAAKITKVCSDRNKHGTGKEWRS